MVFVMRVVVVVVVGATETKSIRETSQTGPSDYLANYFWSWDPHFKAIGP